MDERMNEVCSFRTAPGSCPPPPPRPDPTSSALCRKPVPGGGRPRGDPPPERLRVVRHGRQGAGGAVPRRLRAPVLPAHAQQAAETRLPVRGRLVLRGGGGEARGVRLPALLLRPWGPPDPESSHGSWGGKEEENIKYIVK